MSADNGVYILKTPARPIKNGNIYTNQHGKFEYRVAHCQAIDNIDYSDLYIPLLFGNSVVHDSKESALKEAKGIFNNLDICEYGICTIDKENHFPNMTVEEARKALNSFVDDVIKEEISKKNPSPEDKILEPISAISFEDLPKEFRNEYELPLNGGNVVWVEKGSDFGNWVQQHGFQFTKGEGTWGWLVIFR